MLTALISVNGAVAALIPVVVVVAARAALPPSQLLMPLAFSAHAGSMLALTGTPVNIIVCEAAADAGGRQFGYFEFALAGIPLLVGTVLIIVLFGRRLLPERTPAALPPDLGDLTDALRAQYELPEGELVSTRRGVTEVLVAPRSPLIGQHLFPGQATPSGDLVVLAVHRAGEPLDGPDEYACGPATRSCSAAAGTSCRNTPRAAARCSSSTTRPGLRRGVPLGRGAGRALVILVAMVVLLATGLVPAAIAGLLAAGAVVLSGVLTRPAPTGRSRGPRSCSSPG